MAGIEDREAQSLVNVSLLLTVLLVVVAAWMIVKAFELIVRAALLSPRNKALWVAGGACALSATTALLTAGRFVALDALTILTAVLLLVVAKVIEIYHEHLFLEEVSKGTLVDSALHQPWWSPEPSTNGKVHALALN